MSSINVHNAEQTAALLDFPSLVATLAESVPEYAQGGIHAPERQAVAFPQGGIMLSMPATAHDIAVHKLVNVVRENRARGLATINGVVSAYDGATGCPLFMLDGPTVTARRTAAISMLGLKTLLARTPHCVVLIGTGGQASGHLDALSALYPGLRTVIIGHAEGKAEAFIADHMHLPLLLEAATTIPDEADVIITLTTSATPVYNAVARPDRLIIGVGAFRPDLAEIGADTLSGSVLYIDDPAGGRHEAGDYIQANVDWNTVRSLDGALRDGPAEGQPMVFKSVGCAAWDLAAARCARKNGAAQSE
ncbi:bifunctional Delta(1)-pyrroline-2-carboxylate/Delta(1)-piperideine-2-carboxylate reductase [Pusillimonas sp. ANT_WB101]|uniref:bifunctional Delta(1)-pyrroline-2-carboxylate/Delta(1)-piperideine-2- carboxylate reductase n=1 Tax=Pusillimonas sp. ANT_WB101 TaxID=2597356 RepID=UPI0011EF9F46|nr:bifunctional Delta(1)-pyrroline-2-carboxylate/Delta(1)-piperideine-2-carboxylate reductase [Pusillimonas sp. ANT_WB101]KAA0890648.1 delta(1)-pyrroline-2-carboxylate reductase family protein [Pusillimonas sp. ANT_WB101]